MSPLRSSGPAIAITAGLPGTSYPCWIQEIVRGFCSGELTHRLRFLTFVHTDGKVSALESSIPWEHAQPGDLQRGILHFELDCRLPVVWEARSHLPVWNTVFGSPKYKLRICSIAEESQSHMLGCHLSVHLVGKSVLSQTEDSQGGCICSLSVKGNPVPWKHMPSLTSRPGMARGCLPHSGGAAFIFNPSCRWQWPYKQASDIQQFEKLWKGWDWFRCAWWPLASQAKIPIRLKRDWNPKFISYRLMNNN